MAKCPGAVAANGVEKTDPAKRQLVGERSRGWVRLRQSAVFTQPSTKRFHRVSLSNAEFGTERERLAGFDWVLIETCAAVFGCVRWDRGDREGEVVAVGQLAAIGR